SGDSSPLQNVWEEICGQQQEERSPYWSAYQDLIDQFLWDKVRNLDRTADLALWLQTDSGFNWRIEHHADSDGLEASAIAQDEEVSYPRESVLLVANNEDSSRVKRFLYPEDHEIGWDDGLNTP